MGNPRNTGRRRSIDDDDPKKKKNRDAARKCREKKVQETNNLKKKNEELTKTNEELARKKVELERKLQNCIQEIKKHKDSGCELPKNVMDIMNYSQFQDFIPVGTKVISPTEIANGGNFSMACGTDSFTSDRPPTATGLFSGDALTTSPEQRVRHTSSRSSSRSPPPPTSRRNTNSSTGLTWSRLHQQTVGELSPPGLSPAQTVPNIDADSYIVPDSYQKNNGFPDINEAVKRAQEDPGVMEDAEYHSDSNQGSSYSDLLAFRPEKYSLPSLGFVTNEPQPSVPNHYLTEQNGIGNMSSSAPSLGGSSNALKRKSSGSTVVSMNHTAELLSQAMTNFEASEISEDLKKQYVQLANGADVNSQTIPRGAQNDWLLDGGSNPAVQQQQAATNQIQVQTPVSAASDQVSYDALLELARNLGKNITVQYKGQDYECNYEQVEMLVSYMKKEDNDQQNANTNNPPFASSILSANIESIQPLVDTTMSVSNFPQDPSQIIYTPQDSTQGIASVMQFPNITYITQNDIPVQYSNALNQGVNTLHIPQMVEVQDQTVQVPTTVLSMIQEETLAAKPGPSNETSLDSMDYSANVQDLPSLSLTEDHTHIFEKRRKI